VRRKGKHVNEIFPPRKDAEERTLEIERRIGLGESAVGTTFRDAKTFVDLITFRRATRRG